MSRPTSTCPNCGATIEFRWSGAVQTVCSHCRSVVVRHDVDLRRLGEVSELPADQLADSARHDRPLEDDAFTVIGRIVYEHDDGAWNEWHLVFAGRQQRVAV